MLSSHMPSDRSSPRKLPLIRIGMKKGLGIEGLKGMKFADNAAQRESHAVFPKFSSLTLRTVRIWAKLAELGLGEEKDLMKSTDLAHMEEMEGMKEATPLTERSTSLNSTMKSAMRAHPWPG